MTREELLKMLGMKDQAPVAKPVEVEEELPEPVEVTDHVLEVTDWDLCRATEYARSRKQDELDINAVADFFAACFMQAPEVVGNCYDQRRQEFVETLLQTPDFQASREATRGNVYASLVAVEKLVDEFLRLKRRQYKDPKERRRGIDGAVAVVTKEIDEELELLEGMLRGLGGDGADPSTMDLTKVAKLHERVRRSSLLWSVMERSGRMRRASKSLQRQKTLHGSDDLVGVELAGDPARLVPLELALLADEDLELDAMRRLMENQSMCRQYRATEPKKSGPVIVVVDESGSMRGSKAEGAKALALTMAWIARHQGRWCALVGFAGGTEGNVLVLRPDNWDEEALLAWIEHFYGGGTTMDVPLAELPKMWAAMGAPSGKTDLVMITDAIVRVPAEMECEFKAWKRQSKAVVRSLVLEASAGDLERISDEVHLLPEVELGQDGVESCLGV